MSSEGEITLVEEDVTNVLVWKYVLACVQCGICVRMNLIAKHKNCGDFYFLTYTSLKSNQSNIKMMDRQYCNFCSFGILSILKPFLPVLMHQSSACTCVSIPCLKMILFTDWQSKCIMLHKSFDAFPCLF